MSEESRKAETLRAAGMIEYDDLGRWWRPTWLDNGDGQPSHISTEDALALVAAERAREDRALLATLAAGVEASLNGDSTLTDEAFGKYVRRRFAALYGRAPEIGAPPADDAAAKVARVEALLASVDGGVRATLIPTADIRAALAGKETP